MVLVYGGGGAGDGAPACVYVDALISAVATVSCTHGEVRCCTWELPTSLQLAPVGQQAAALCRVLLGCSPVPRGRLQLQHCTCTLAGLPQRVHVGWRHAKRAQARR